MVSEDKLVEIIEKQTKISTQIEGRLSSIDNKFEKVLDKYGEFHSDMKVMKILLVIMVGLVGAIFITSLTTII
ncbi:MAG: hypothetical protein A7316_07440 [Candidatus Altiarchaeales archaeon WOR_SM1_86-2]|nr:MAG: hypothetical protein A7316_07440 [Candidatus Altiarchaeales archaeon WOR_SM1_86-2]